MESNLNQAELEARKNAHISDELNANLPSALRARITELEALLKESTEHIKALIAATNEARAEARVWENRTRCLFTKYCSRTFDCPTEGYLERTIVKLDEEIAAADKEA